MSPSVAVACVAAGVAAATLLAAHLLTRGLVGEDVFLKNYRKLFWEESLLYHKMRYAETSKEYNDVLALGDSTALLDLDPRRLAEDARLTAYNLGTFGWLQPDGHLEILRDYLASHPKPRLVVYTVGPTELTDAYSRNEDFKDRFVWTYGPELRKERGWTRWPLEWRLREEYRTLVGRLAGMGARYERQEVGAGLDHVALGKVLAEQRGFFGRRNPNPWPVAPVKAFKMGGFPASGLRKLARYCQDEGIWLWIRVAPIPEEASAPEPGDLEEWLDGLAKEFPRVLVDKPVILRYPKSWFNDMMHLDSAGAARFTSALVPRLTAILNARPGSGASAAPRSRRSHG